MLAGHLEAVVSAGSGAEAVLAVGQLGIIRCTLDAQGRRADCKYVNVSADIYILADMQTIGLFLINYNIKVFYFSLIESFLFYISRKLFFG